MLRRPILRLLPRLLPSLEESGQGGSLQRSIQGEQQDGATSTYIRASEDDVDLYVDRVTDEVIACRERGRHLFPTIRQAGIRFTDVDSDGLLIRRLTCTCCQLAVKVEKWEGVRSGGRTRFSRVASTLEYRTGDNGETYLAPSGRGHMTPRQIGDSVASKALAGQTLTQLRKDAKAAAAAKTTSSKTTPSKTTPSTTTAATTSPTTRSGKKATSATTTRATTTKE